MLLVTQTCFSADERTVELKQISEHVWIHTSYSLINGQLIDSHGVIIVNYPKIVLVDTCWNTDQTATLLRIIESIFHAPVSFAIISHAHQDRIGGIETLQRNKVRTISTALTAQKASLAGYIRPLPELDSQITQFSLTASDSSNVKVEVFYPGPGHTEDNITVWIPSDRVLFGGCLVRSIESIDLGNTADAAVNKWALTVSGLQTRYPNAEIVIPGHGSIGNFNLLKHTIDLVNSKMNQE